MNVCKDSEPKHQDARITYRSPITDAVGAHHAETELHEYRDLVPPSNRQVRETMDQEAGFGVA